MSAQLSATTPPTLEGETVGPHYGQEQDVQEQAAASTLPPNTGQAAQPLLNGVDPRREDVARDGARVAGPPYQGHAQTGSGSSGGLDAERAVEEAAPGLLQAEQTAVLIPVSSAGYESLPTTRPTSPVRRDIRPQSGQPHQAERTVSMEYSFQQAEGQPAVRWVARLTEFLRSTTRANGFQGRILEGLGLNTTTTQHPQEHPTLRQQHAFQQQHRQFTLQQAATPLSMNAVARPIDLQNYTSQGCPIPPPPAPRDFTPAMDERASPSPPPRPPPLPPVPAMESPMSMGGRSFEPYPPAEPSLFTPQQASRLGRLEREAPWLYPRQGPPSSTSSEEVQAEVQRQLRSFIERHDGEAQRLRDEVERLQLECQRLQQQQAPLQDEYEGNWTTGGLQTVPQGDRATSGLQTVPQGDRATSGLQTVPQGDRATSGLQTVPRSDRATSGLQTVPQGDRATSGLQTVPQGDRATSGLQTVPRSDRATSGLQTVPQGDRATSGLQTVPQGDRATSGLQTVPQGDRATSGLQTVPQGDRATSGLQTVPRSDRATGGLQTVPQGDRATSGQDAFSQGRAVTEYFDLQDGDRAWHEEQQRTTGVPEADEGAQGRTKKEDAGNEQSTPSTMDLLGVIATGMRQLQDVQLRQLEKKTDAPEVVKPGISSLPTLSAPGQDTSPVDIQDWLEEAGSVMTDLSDSSWEWWLQTQELAESHYLKWIKSTPMEKISLAMPKSPGLEQGRYGRVNARAAGMVLAALPSEVKSEMITKKVTGSTASLLFKLLTVYRPGGEKEKTLLLQQLTSPDPASSAEEAVQALRRWGRWHARAKDLTVAVPDPVLMIKGLASIVSGVLTRHQEVWLRTSMVRQKLKLDSNPTEETTLDYYKHLQAEMELLSTASTTSKPGPKVRSVTSTEPSATTSSTSSTATAKPKASPVKEKPCRWFAKTDSGCRRGVDCTFSHDWGSTSKAGRCLVCSSTSHVKKDCPVKEKGASAKLSKPRAETSTSAPTSTPAATRSLSSLPEGTAPVASQQQPAAEPSPTTSPSAARTKETPEEERPEEIKQMLADASRMLKSMLARGESGTPATSSSAPSYESIQKQLDELRLKSLRVDGVQLEPSSPRSTTRAEFVDAASTSTPAREEYSLNAMKVSAGSRDEEKGTLLDSGSTHVLRPARDDEEKAKTQQVFVTLAGDERRLLDQAPSGSIIVGDKDDATVQSIIPFGKVIECLGCTLKWTKAGFHLHHPRHGRITTRVRSGCPEITDAGQAAAIIAELEMKKVAELKERTQQLQDQLSAVRMMQQQSMDWRMMMARYVEKGAAVDGLQAVHLSPMFGDLPNHVRVAMAPEIDLSEKAGWNHLKLLPLPRRVRKRLFKSDTWVLNMFAGGDKRRDPLQALSGATSTQSAGEAVVLNVDVMLSAGWNLQGEMYKALLWGAMNSKVKAVVASPPTRGFEPIGEFTTPASYQARCDKDREMLAKTLFLHLISYTAMKGAEPLVSIGAPIKCKGFWSSEMVKKFQEVVAEVGVCSSEFDQGALGHPSKAPMRILHNVGLEMLQDVRDERPDHLRPGEDPGFPPRVWCPGLRRAVYDGMRHRGLGDGAEIGGVTDTPELRKLTKEQGWKLHILRDHVPFRRDCEQCVMMMGTGRPRRRIKQKSCYVLSVDVGGPLRAVSKDAHGSGYKYFLAASYTKPKFEDQDPPPDHPPEDLAAYDFDFKNLEADLPQPGDPIPPEGGVFDSPEEADLPQEDEQYSPSEEDLEPFLRKVDDTKGLWDDDDFAAIEQEREAQEAQDEHGNHEVPTDFLYYFKPLKGKSGKHVLKAIQEIVLQLRMENLPVVRIHADRAHEMRSEALRQWTLDNNILLTRTEGQAPQSNGTAERAVRFLKGRARSLLRAADLGAQHWATAMATAAHRQREERLRPEFPNIPAAYGAKVAIKKKYYGQGGKLDLLPRWVKGTYMGPVWDVNQGSAILEEETNRFTVSTHLRAKLVDPGTIRQEPEMVVEPPPRRRLRGKTAVDDDGIKAKAMVVASGTGLGVPPSFSGAKRYEVRAPTPVGSTLHPLC